MDILSLQIANFLTIGSATLELDNRGLLLIQGENLDDTSAKSNGAGKSSIVDALCWSLFGETARGISGDLVVNDSAKKDCSVSVTLKDGAEMYMIQRFRKDTKNKNQLYAWQLAGGTSTALHKGTDKETQAVVDKIIGCSLDVFAGSIYAGQERMPDLPGMTDKFLKLLVEEAAGVEVLAEVYAVAQKAGVVSDRALLSASNNSINCTQRLKDAKDMANEADEQIGLFEVARKDKAREELSKILPHQAEIKEVQAGLLEIDKPTLTARKTVIEGEIAASSTQKLEQTTHARAKNAADKTLYACKTELARLKKCLDTANHDLTNVDAMIGKPCGSCGKVYCEHDLDDARTAKKLTVASFGEELKKQAEKTRIALTQFTATSAALDAYELTMTDVSAISGELGSINTSLGANQRLEDKIESLTAAIAAIKKTAASKLTETNPWRAMKESREKAQLEAQKALEATQAALSKAEAHSKLIADAVKVFGPAGVRAHILDSVTPFLNDRTGEYLGSLADGNIHAVWSTLEKNSKGELKEKFNIAVTNDKGGKTFAAQSGGEKRKVRLACALALQDMVASRATKPIRLFLADEIDDALDEPGLERLMGVLDIKAKERGTVMVISHRSLSDWIDSVITITKSGGLATVAGCNVRGF